MRWGWLVAALAGFALIVILISAYLSPNNLRSCSGVGETHPCQKADAIVAISGGDTRARTAAAIRLYQHGWADKLILSGAALDPDSPSNAEVMRDQALSSGVADEAIILDTTSRSTTQNASNSSNIFSENHINDVILVTSAYHQRRAYLEFSKQSPGVHVRNSPVQNDSQWSDLWWLTPSGWWLAGSELVKVFVFFIGDSR